MKPVLSKLTRRLSRPFKAAAKQRRLAQDYTQAVRERSRRYGGQDLGYRTQPTGGRALPEACAALERDGFVVLEDVFSPEGLRDVARELEQARASGTLYPTLRGTGEPGASQFLSDEEHRRGEDYVKTQAHIVFVRDPFVACPSALRYVFSDEIIDFAAALYGCPPLLVAGKVMRSYVNELPRTGFYKFHCDDQSTRIIKFFLYLHDVDEAGGPFTYVRGSHRRKPRDWHRKAFWEDSEIVGFYGQQAIRGLSARAGSVIVTDTTGFHRAAKPVSREREALLITTGVHRFPGEPVRVGHDHPGELSPKQRALLDVAEVVPGRRNW